MSLAVWQRSHSFGCLRNQNPPHDSLFKKPSAIFLSCRLKLPPLPCLEEGHLDVVGVVEVLGLKKPAASAVRTMLVSPPSKEFAIP